MTKLFQQFDALPRSIRWLTVFLLLLGLYLGPVEYMLDQANQLNQKADLLAAGLRQEEELLSPESPKGRLLSDGRRLFGEPLLPGDPGSRPEAVHQAIDRILDTHGVTKRTKNERRVPFRGDELTNLLGAPGMQKTAERMILDIIFEAPPETVTAIIQELEQAKEIALIYRIELRRPDAGRDAKSGAPVSSGKILKVTISPEAWIATAASSGGGGV